MHSLRLHVLAGSLALAFAWPAAAGDFNVMPLVTDNQAAHPAQITDSGLINAWGISFGPSSPFWVSAEGTGTSPLYRVDPLTQATTKLGLTVTVPGHPTGQVFNSGAASGAFNGNLFLFVSTDGAISGWRGSLGTTAEVLQSASSANVYTGAGFGTVSGSSYLYGANFLAGAVDVVKGSAANPSLTGSFTDPNLPAGYSPFNVQNLGGTMYVAYALQNEEGDEEVAGPGLGIVDAFDLQGNFLSRVATGGTLNAPWGMAIAPSSFGSWAGALLVGNFGDGRINAFDASTHSFLGQVTGPGGQPLVIDGLWAITPGNDGNAGSSAQLYFTAGPDEEAHGMFGVLVAVPEPATWATLAGGLLMLTVWRRRHS
ncbi:MAG TPA: TIGR03118 family protein [Albitalea sp.]|uniref:TIGR03118 family protein n=1 Tax=Piscinibacter sp. TaxID=1903157 RepID=UPI002ED3E162